MHIKLVCDSRICRSGDAFLIHLRRIRQIHSPNSEDNERLRQGEKAGEDKGRDSKEGRPAKTSKQTNKMPSSLPSKRHWQSSSVFPAFCRLPSQWEVTGEAPVDPCSHIDCSNISSSSEEATLLATHATNSELRCKASACPLGFPLEP